MKRRITCTALALCLCLSLLPAPALAAEEAGGGGVDYIVSPTADIRYLSDFQEGIAPIGIKGQAYGYITSEGKIIASQLEQVFPFREGRGLAYITGAQMKAATHHEDGTITLNTTPYDSSATNDGGWNPVGPFLVTVSADGTMTPITQYNKETGSYEPAVPYNLAASQSVGGFIPAYYEQIDKENHLSMMPEYEFYDENGVLHGGFGLICASPATEGLRLCNIEAISWGSSVYIDDNGEIALDLFKPELFGPVHEESTQYMDGFGPIKQSFRQITSLRPFHRGLAPACQSTYEYDPELNYWQAENKKAWGFIDKTGQFVIPPQYQNFMVGDANVTYQVFCGGVAMVKDGNGHWGGIDKNGKTVIPFQYEAADIVSEGIVAVQKNGKWGGVDTTGKLVIPFDYDSVFTFNEGVARVESGGKYGFVDATGKLVIPCIYDEADNACFEGMIGVNQDGKEGYVDATGQVVIPLDFNEVRRFCDGVAFVQDTEGKWGIIANPSFQVAEVRLGLKVENHTARLLIQNISKVPIHEDILTVIYPNDDVLRFFAGDATISQLGVYYPIRLDLEPGEVFDSQFSPVGNFALLSHMENEIWCAVFSYSLTQYEEMAAQFEEIGEGKNIIPANQAGRQFLQYVKSIFGEELS